MFRMMICRDGRCWCVLDDGMLDRFILMDCTGGLGMLCMLWVIYLG